MFHKVFCFFRVVISCLLFCNLLDASDLHGGKNLNSMVLDREGLER